MNANRFDTITKHIATRREALRVGGLGVAALAATPVARGAAQNGTPAATPAPLSADPHPSADDATVNPMYLFVQPFESGTWEPKDGEDGMYTLTLSGADANTVYFSDRPERITGLAPTQQFLDGLGFTPNDPPNAAVVAQRPGGGEQEVLMIELFNPVYDANAGTLTYDAAVLADYGEPGLAHLAQQQQDYELGETFEEGSLFIDSCSSKKWECHLKSDMSIVGDMKFNYCWNWSAVECKPCHSPGKFCAEQFDECLGSDGSHLCTASEL